MKRRYYFLLLLLVVPYIWCFPVLAAYIDFESTPSFTLVRDQFQSLGVRISSTDNIYGGLVYSEGTYGVENYGNSHTQVMDIGGYGHVTTIRFVDPLFPEDVIGATSVSFVIGDGDPDIETFSITYRDPTGTILIGPTTYITDQSGLWLNANQTDLGGLIGYIDLYLEPTSQSGVTFDDLNFNSVPIPGAIWLLGTGLVGLVAIRRQNNK